MRKPVKKYFRKCTIEREYIVNRCVHVFLIRTEYDSLARFCLNIPDDDDTFFYDSFLKIMGELPRRNVQ